MALPVGRTRISHESNMPRPMMSQFSIAPAATISVKKLTPMPIKFADLAAREGFAIAPLLVMQTRVVDRGKRLGECGRIVAAVFPAANTAPGMSQNDGQERR